MADAVPADVEEFLDSEVGNELSRLRSARGILQGRCGDRVPMITATLSGSWIRLGVDPHRRELQVDHIAHVDLDGDDVARSDLAEPGLAGEQVLDHGHAHGFSGSFGAVAIAEFGPFGEADEDEEVRGFRRHQRRRIAVPASSARLVSIA